MNFNLEALSECDTFIFDFDGTLIDSEPYNKRAHSIVLSSMLNRNIVLSDKDYEKYMGKKDVEIYKIFKNDFGIDFDINEMVNKQAIVSRDFLLSDEVKVYNYFFELAKCKGNTKFYVVSNHHPIGLFPVLEKKGVIGYCDNVFCMSQMNVDKDYFYKNIKEFIPNARKIVVFEDDAKILSLSKKLGYNVVAIQNTSNAQFIEGFYHNIIKVW